MKSVNDFIVKPIEGRYNNTVKVGDVDLVVNTKIEEFKSISKVAEVVALPLSIKTNIKIGDKVIVHHNIFRRFYDIRGKEKNSRSFIKENMYACSPEQIYMYGVNTAHLDYCFVKPLSNDDIFITSKEKPLMGLLKYGNKGLDKLGVYKGDLISFRPTSEFEFVIDGELLYCMKLINIVAKHERKGNEKEYNPSWTKSG
jgi:hypothetical protein|tara:strand:- start:1340 stop:1936 length:597 start_codon:yes stop_codon:yes gene_type:complete